MERGRAADQRVRLRARQRDGVLLRSDLVDLGISRAGVATRVAAGEWQPVGRAWIVAAVSRPSDRQQAWLLQANAAQGAEVSGPIALRLRGWNVVGSELIVRQASHQRIPIAGVTVIRIAAGRQLESTGALRLATVEDALADSLVCLSHEDAEALLDVALQRHYITADDFLALVNRRAGRGRRGAAVLQRLARQVIMGTRSEAERRMARLLKACGSSEWTANFPVVDSRGRVLAEIDFAHELLRIAIEVDGRAHHSDRRAFERDRQRQNMLTLEGWVVLRFTWEQITRQPETVRASVRRAMAQQRERQSSGWKAG